MTNFDENGIITPLYIYLSNDNILKITVEVNVAQNNSNVPRDGYFSIRDESEKMENMNVNLSELTNYLIQLFYKTNKIFSCTRTKVGKMLSILAFDYAVKRKILFDEPIYKYANCGTSIADIMRRFEERKDIYVWYGCDDIDTEKDCQIDYDECVRIPDAYYNISSLSEDVKNQAKIVFEKFAMYSPEKLGELINTILICDGVVNDNKNGEIDLSTIGDLTMESFVDNISDKTLIEYLFKE